MIFSRVLSFVSFLTLFLCFSVVASGPATFPQARSDVKRQTNADVDGVLANLQSQLGTILPQIDALSASGNATDAEVTPLIGQLNDALNGASDNLGNIPALGLRKRQSDQDTANQVASIVTDITNSLNGIHGHPGHISTLTVLLASVDVALHRLLIAVDILLVGVLKLVAVLLVDVAKLLRGLAFTLTLTILAL
ncbi:hypothetical protein K435DRAFT_763928 [Dendrothele bispora CBS 962.96]|uniref:Sc15 protein n=1 Tax=Dendrothele bispora (strain CBS 962.96) TaxID=1314807 RepID=A0A4S8LB05_DENBC|nr:hypothetical protein K435DRAFT_763928 [Dendrothele bispora CBS 962.96]